MGLFGKKGGDDRGPAEGAEQRTEPRWALPADADVAAGGSSLGPSTPAGAADRASTTGQPTTAPGLSGAAVTSPSVGGGASPAAAAAAQSARNLDARAGTGTPPAGTMPPPSIGGAETGSSSGAAPGLSSFAAAQQKPELVVAGAFAGAFLAARILRRITE